MDLENQRRVKELTEKYGAENIVVLIGGAEAESAGLAAKKLQLETQLLQVHWQEFRWDLKFIIQ